MSFIDTIIERAKKNKRRIILPESMDQRVLEAADYLVRNEICDVILIGSKESILKTYPMKEIEKIQVIDPEESSYTEGFINDLYELRKEKGLSYEDAFKFIHEDYMYFSCMMIYHHLADGIVSGACHSTSNTLRPALQIIKTKKDVPLVSSFFLMVVPDCSYGENGVFVFSDCGLEQNPTSEKLSSIAYSSAKSFELLVEKNAKVAFLSHSTMGSAKHEDVDKVVEAVRITKKQYPDLCVDGELQLDAAIDKEVAKMKAPNSPVAGCANVLIFPDLDAGNIGYKLVQRLAKADAYGPICQGMKAPINDLSRGCSVSDIVGVVAITALQAENL